MSASGPRLPRVLISIGIVTMILVSLSAVLIPVSSSGSNPSQTAQPWETAGTPSTTAYPHCVTANTQVQVASEDEHVGNIVVNRGQTYVIANRTFTEIGNVIVNGGNFVVNNATFKGHDPNSEGGPGSLFPVLIGGGCMEFTDTKEFAVDQLRAGGNNPTATPDNSTLYVNHSTMYFTPVVTGKNVTVKIADSVLEGGVIFGGYADIYGNQSKMTITSSLVDFVMFTFQGGTGGNISDLRPGYLKYWNLHQNLTVYGMPYDLTLNDVTIVPNLIGSGFGLELGWGIIMGPSWSGQWPNLTITNSVLTQFQFFNIQAESGFSSSTSVFLSGVGSPHPLTQTFFGSIRLVNTTTDDPTVGCDDCTVVLSDFRGTGIVVSGHSNITLIDSSIGDTFILKNCTCTFKSVDSVWGSPKNFTAEDLAYHQYLPNATEFATWNGGAFFPDSIIKITGNLTYNMRWHDIKVFPQIRNSTLARTYPVLFTDRQGRGISNLPVSLITPSGMLIRQMTTNQNGRLDVPIVFNDANYTTDLLLSTKFGSLSCQAPIGFMSGTPLRLGDSVVSFTETGLPPGAPWSVTVNGPTLAPPSGGSITLGTTLSSSSGSPIDFCLAAGNYTYGMLTTEALGKSYRHYASPAFATTPQSGSLTLNGGVTRVNLSFAYQGSALSVQSGTGAFSPLSSSNKGIVVAPGQRIQGSISITSVNRYGWPSTSMIGTPSWGDPSTSYWVVRNFNLANDTSTLSVPIDLAAATQPGTYYLLFASLSDSPAGTASQTNVNSNLSPVWNAGNGIASLNSSQVGQAQAHGFIRSNVLQNKTANIYALNYVAVDAVKITVSTEAVSTTIQQSTSTIPTTSSTVSTTTAATSSTAPTTQQATTAASTTGGGGIPEFPYQTVVATVFTALVVVSYLLVRRHPYTSRLRSWRRAQ